MSGTPENAWPDLSGLTLQPTMEALHLWSQVAGKIKLMTTPWLNHSWHVPLYVTARGLSTGLMSTPARSFEIEFDLLSDRMIVRDTDGREQSVALQPQSVADFHAAAMRALSALNLEVEIDCMPCELDGAVPFHQDDAMRQYDGNVARAYWRALLQIQRVFHLFRTRFVGKCSPIHLFWGSFDLALTRFSGRAAPPHPGGAVHMSDAVAREAYSQEVSSAGFWPGGGPVKAPSFYSYSYPTPSGFGAVGVAPAAAYFDAAMGEFLLPYDAVSTSADPDEALLSFLQSTYEAAANLGQWDRATLEGPAGPIGSPPATA
jgi:hypothetical protein